jgi:tetratricopeptide (TPR) repeat protein
VSGLKVIARTSSFAFKGKNQDLREVGSTLGVNNVLEGSVRKSGERVRITAQLINVADGSHIWSDSYDRTLTDIFQIQDEVAGAIVDALQVHVGARPERGRPTENLEAYDLFLQAKATGLTWQQATRYLQAAIALDPQFAEAYELLALRYWNAANAQIKASEGQRLTFAAAEQALALDPSLAMARALARSADLEGFSWIGELQAMEQLVREQPSNANALGMLVFDLIEAGYVQEAFQYAQRAIVLDPLSGVAKQRFGESLVSVGRREEAMTSALPWLLGDLYFFTKQYDTAADQYSSVLADYIGITDTTWVRDAVEKGRDPIAGQEYLDALIEDQLASLPEDKRYSFWINIVNWYVVFGHLDRYFQIIQSLDLTSSTWTDADWLVYMGTVERAYTGFTAHPDYVKVAGAIGLVEVWDQRGAPDFCHKEDGNWLCE